MLPSLPPLAAEQVFHIGSLPVTNTFINALAAMLLFGILALFLNLGIKKFYPQDKAPKGIVNFFESLIEFMLVYVDNVTKDRKKSLKILPICGGIFLFILTSNYIGLLPGMSSIGIFRGSVFTPLFRSANSDLNLTLAMAVFAVVASHILGIMTVGFFKYANKFIKLGDIYQAIIKFSPINILIAIIEFFVGLIEIFSELAKMVSLSLRLFGNVFAGEILLTVLATLIAGYGAFGIPLPFIALELLVGFIQATVFSMLTLVYLTVAMQEPHGHADTDHHTALEDETPAV
jgi:F-type H+-transporting ATPase subunit a